MFGTVEINSSSAAIFSIGVLACLNLFSASKYSGGRLAGIVNIFYNTFYTYSIFNENTLKNIVIMVKSPPWRGDVQKERQYI
jgi:hypothetical protein